MSFRELRSFAETMRLLGYPNLISMESFRTPNVELVADCLYWLIKRYEPSSEVVYDIERESDRVFFFKSICEAVLSKARLKLNIKKLYQADGYAVQEMLKFANVLKKAMRATDEEEPDFAALQQMAAQRNAQDAKAVQHLCSDLTTDGSSLFFQVEAEIQSRGERQQVLSRATEVGEFERRLRELLTSVTQQVGQLQTSISNLSADESNLEQKIESKKTQLERAQKRFKSLMAVRPAFIEEYEKHEAELQSQFVKYLEQYRNLEYLEYQLAKYNEKEDAQLREQQTQLSVMRERLRKEELQSLRANAGGASNTLDRDAGSDDDADDSSVTDQKAGSYARIRVRDASKEGSSDESDEESEQNNHLNGRPQNAAGRSRPAPSTDAPKRDGSGGEYGTNNHLGTGGPTSSGRPPMATGSPSSGGPHAAVNRNQTSGFKTGMGSDTDSSDYTDSSDDDDSSDDSSEDSSDDSDI